MVLACSAVRPTDALAGERRRRASLNSVFVRLAGGSAVSNQWLPCARGTGECAREFRELSRGVRVCGRAHGP